MLEEGSNKEDKLESLDASPQSVGRSLSAATASANTDSHSLVTEWCNGLLLSLLFFLNQNELFLFLKNKMSLNIEGGRDGEKGRR